VARTEQFLSDLDVWFQLGRNRPAHGCRDAARKRVRLGSDGIDLWDELKSFFGGFRNADGANQHFVAHCRADRLVDLPRVQAVLRAQALPERLDEPQLRRFGLRYGVINPFESWAPYTLDAGALAAPVLQVFDRDVLEPLGVAGTVMTNASHQEWSVEFRPEELVKRLAHVLEADISKPDPEADPRPAWASQPPTIGILTGNAAESGMALWQAINRHVRTLLGPRCRGDLSLPPVLVHSLPALGLTMELDRRHEAAWGALRHAVTDLCLQGVRLLAVACHTSHYFGPRIHEICAEHGAEFISMPEVLARWLRAQGIRDLALVGVRYVSDLGPWSAYAEPLSELDVETPGDRAIARIHDLAYQVKTEGVNEAGLNRLRDILRNEVRSPNVVLALTELSLLLAHQRQPGRSGKVLIDPLDLCAQALACRYLGLPFPRRQPSETG